MLVLSRKVQESLVIGPDVTVTVLAIRGQRIQLGIDAPRSVVVLREEIVPTQGEPGEDRKC